MEILVGISIYMFFIWFTIDTIKLLIGFIEYIIQLIKDVFADRLLTDEGLEENSVHYDSGDFFINQNSYNLERKKEEETYSINNYDWTQLIQLTSHNLNKF